jgi:serine/threonine protein kinase
MFHNEINIIKRLNHPNIIKTHEIMYSSNYAFVVNDLCDLGQIMKWDEKKQNFTHNPAVI